jgi:N-methylhydantoinase A
MSARLGVDVGGTFTDVVLEVDGTLTSVKVLTTHQAPEQGILDAVDVVLTETGVAIEALSTIIHGTTLATNALIERRGAKTAFVTTAGFRDVIETRTESRFEQYDLNLVLPAPLIERRHRHAVTERLSASGEVLVPLDEAQAVGVIDQLATGGYEAVAVGFLHSYVDARHERRFGELVAERLPDVVLSLSADVSPQMREFERFNTVCANAFVQPVMATYLHRLEAELARRGAVCPVFLMHSGGGLMSLEDAARFPVRLVESGPAGGAIFAADIAERYGLDRVLSYDMGGTTAKICLIEGHTPHTAKTFEVARTHRFTKGSGMPISIPVIEMIEIGAGGGSIASVDVLGQIRVGPESAGSEPGPASYQLGGTRPTVTDANLVLGRLSADTFGAESIDLSSDVAGTAIVDGVGVLLSVDATDGAIGIVEVVDENMANAARVHAVENGKDLLGFTVIAFGGGAPLHAGRLCDKLGVDQLLVPPGAGVGSAIGFLRAPFAYEAIRSHYERIDRFDHETVNHLLAELTAEADGFVRGGTTDERLVERWVHMRYAGQGWEIPVRLGDGAFDALSAQQLAVRFEKSYEEYFGRAIEGLAIEAVSWAVRVATPRPSVEPVAIVDASYEVVSDRTRLVHDSATGGAVEAAVVERHALEPGHRVRGPAVIVESQTTTWIGSRHEVVAQADGCLLVRLGEPARR